MGLMSPIPKITLLSMIELVVCRLLSTDYSLETCRTPNASRLPLSPHGFRLSATRILAPTPATAKSKKLQFITGVKRIAASCWSTVGEGRRLSSFRLLDRYSTPDLK